MPLIKPFRALRPAPGRAAEVLAPPYDVLSSAEARARAQGKPWSFLHISKPEIDLDPSTDPYDRAVYAKAAENLAKMIAGGVLTRDAKASYYVYRLTWRGHTQTGLSLRRLARRLRHQPHPQARADHAAEGRRPRAPDRGGERADRPGDDRLPERAGNRRSADASRRRQAGSRRYRRRRRAPSALGDRRRRHDRQAQPRLRCLAGDLHRRRPSPLGGGRTRCRRAQGRGFAQLFPVGASSPSAR